MVSPLQPTHSPNLEPMAGVTIQVAHSGMKYHNRPDFLVMTFDELRPIAIATTQSTTAGAPVAWCKQASVCDDYIKSLVVNAGNANAFTGDAGDAVTRHTALHFAQKYGCKQHHIYQASTGVIGEPMAADVFAGIDKTTTNASWQEAAEAILTTDSFAKKTKHHVTWGGQTYPIQAISKGSGMIAPNMATMLSFMVTNAPIPPAILQETLQQIVPLTYNAISVDSDTSTSDIVLCIAGAANADAPLSISTQDKVNLYEALFAVAHDCALQVIKDGEGISKLITVKVTEASDEAMAKNIAFAIINSPLVKTAIAGEDANWGRIIMAIGKTGAPIKQENLRIYFGDILVAEKGARASSYDEALLSNMLKQSSIDITVALHMGNATFCAYGCDLTHEYISINADYRS